MSKTQASLPKIVIHQDAEKPIERGVLAKAIVDISQAAKRLADSGLNRDAVVILLAHKTSCGIGTIRAVLAGLEQLERDYVKR